MEKKTKREVLGIIKELLADNADVVAYVDNEVALLDKKNAYRKEHKAPTKAQLAAEALKPAVLAAVTAEGKPSKVIAEAVGEPYQKITPILKALVWDGKVTSEKVNGVSLYRLVVEE